VDALTRADDGTLILPASASDWIDWVPASSLRNWCRDDTLVDWLSLYGEAKGFAPDDRRPEYDPRYDYWSVLYEQAARFEREVVACLRRDASVTTIASSSIEGRSLDLAMATVQAMQRGDAIIYQGVLRDAESRTFGVPDLLIRADLLARLIPSAFEAEDDPVPAPGLGATHHYRVVDVKFTTLRFTADGRVSVDLAYLAQLWSYNRALGRIQGFRPPSSYLLGRSWEQGERRGRGCFERLGRVHHDEVVGREKTPLSSVVAEATAWLRRVRREGSGWDVLPKPSVPELWPNMKEHDSAPWASAKREIAHKLEDLTLLWRVGPENRSRGHREGVFRWTDARTTAEILGLAGKRGQVLDALLQANRSPDGPLVRPARVRADGESWRAPASVECYVDFETVTDVNETFARMPERGGQPLIFQVGCGRMTPGGWVFRQFTASTLTLAAEREMLDAWCSHVEELARESGVEVSAVRLVHWSPAETSTFESAYNSARARHPEAAWPTFAWYDLLTRVVAAEPITVRGCFGFGLKEVASALYRHGLIALSWGQGPGDGLGAMAGALRLGARDLREDPVFLEQVSKYNEADCRIMFEVLQYIRSRH
jgi:hypothetical protein